MQDGKNFRIAIRMPEVFYVLRNHESKEPDRFEVESELIKIHLSDEVVPVSSEVQLGREQIDTLCRILNSKFTTETKNISSFKNYIFNLESSSRKSSLLEVKKYLQEMRKLEKTYKGDNLYSFFLNHWYEKGEDFYFILKSIDLTGIRVVQDSSLRENLTDEQKIDIFLETY